MRRILHINVIDKIATYLKRDGNIVCGNNDYQVEFLFDSEWDSFPRKTARFIVNGKYTDVIFTGSTCPVPIITNTDKVTVGVYAGELCTTTPATIDCETSILCGSNTPTPEGEAVNISEAKEAADRAEAAADRAEATIEEYVTPEMFGAVGDGVADDTEAFQNAVNAAINRNLPLLIKTIYRITSINITNKYSCNLKIIGCTQASTRSSKIIVYGSDSVGLDFSGTEDAYLENLYIVGDNNDKPKCLMYACRTTANQQCNKFTIRSCCFTGNVIYALVYNVAGEMWSIRDTSFIIPEDSSAMYGFYGTAINSLDVISPFATFDSRFGYLTHTKFKDCSFSTASDAISVFFETNASSVSPDILISNITFDGCYAYNPNNSSYVFKDCQGSILFIGCNDESGAVSNAQRLAPMIHCYGTNQLTGFEMHSCLLYGMTETPFLKAECPIVSYNNIGCRTFHAGTWDFTTLNHAKHDFLRNSERFTTTMSKNVEIARDTGSDRTNYQEGTLETSNIVLMQGNYRQIPNNSYYEYEGSPKGVLSAAPGSVIKDTLNNVFYIGYRWDIWSWKLL